MTKALFIDTATERGLISFYAESKPIYHENLPIGLTSSAYLLPAIQQALSHLRLSVKDLAYVGVGIGPGSYTGMRVGAMVAKTLSFACRIPLVGLNTLSGFVIPACDNFAVIIDAKVSGTYCLKSPRHQMTLPQIVPLEKVQEYLGSIEMLVTPKLMPLKQKLEAVCPDNNWHWSESGLNVEQVGHLMWARYQKGEVCTDTNIELLYLRETQAERQAMESNQRHCFG